jgi:prepilin-type N-terminal cleavage/methylation domain-containing protein
MCNRQSTHRRPAMTMIELLVVIAIILALAALAAAFMPRVQDSTRLSNAIDQLEQWLLTAKMRAKRDGLATGIRLIQDANNPGMYTQVQYVQQPDPLSGGYSLGNGTFSGGYCALATTTAAGTIVTFGNVDFSLGGIPQSEGWLVQAGDYLELRDGGGIHLITSVPPAVPAVNVMVDNTQPVSLSAATANYRILRQPRPLIGENPLQMPGNLAVDMSLSHVQPNVTGTAYDILFSPSGAVVGTNAGLGKIFLYVHDLTQSPVDPARSGVVAVQTLTGFLGAYNAGPAGAPYLYANEGRGSGL